MQPQKSKLGQLWLLNPGMPLLVWQATAASGLGYTAEPNQLFRCIAHVNLPAAFAIVRSGDVEAFKRKIAAMTSMVDTIIR